MAQFANMFEVDLNNRSYPVSLVQTVSEGNVYSNRIGAYVYADGEPVNLGGACTGLVMRADGTTVPLTGYVEGNAAYVVLDQPSCAIPGPIQVAVNSVVGENITTLLVAYGTVILTDTRNYVEPGTPIPDITELLAEIDNMREATAEAEAAASSALTNFAGAFSASKAYTEGQYVTYTDGKFYRFTTNHAAGAWNSAHVVAVTVGGELTDLENVISLSQNITPKSTLTPNPKTIYGVTITILGPGKLHLSGTATGFAAIDHYLSNSALPSGMEYGETYYAAVIGDATSVSKVYSYGTTFNEIYTMHSAWGKFTAPQSGGLAIRTIISSGITYNETVEVVIIKDNVYTQSITNFEDLSENIEQTNILLTESNLPINYAVASTATKTHNGLTFSAVNGVVTVNGTSTGVAFYDLLSLLTNPDEFQLKAGHTYALRFADETLSPLIYKQVAYAVSDSSGVTTLYSTRLLSDYIVFTVPDSLYDFYVRLLCDSSGVTYTNKEISFAIEEITDKKDVIVVDVNGGGDFTSLKTGIEYAMLKYGTKVIVKRGIYDLVYEFGESYLDSLSGGDFGIMLGNGIEVIFAPNAYVSFDYDGTNDWVISNFSPFNTANDLGYTIDGLHCTAHNCRYILHDDPRPGVKGRYSQNIIRNCYFELFPSTEYSSWVNHQIIGGGLGDSTMVNIENCIFIDHFSGVSSYSCVSYHNSTSGNANYESRIVVKDCYFADGNMLVFEGYGNATSKTKIIATNNNFANGDNDVVYNSASADNMTIYKWNNYSRN